MEKHLKSILSEILSSADLVYVFNSYDIVGDIAVLRLTDASRKHAQTIADAVMAVHKNVKTVFAQTGPVHGDFRLRRLEYIAGENRTATTHKEFRCLFFVDIRGCYFSPRLSFERMRIAKQVRNGEVVVNMFGGVGCFSIIVAKHSHVGKVYSIDINPLAVRCAQENVRLNRVYGNVIPILGDAKEAIDKRLCRVADRILMPLPEKAFEYLPYALSAIKKVGGYIHYYDFEHASKSENPVVKTKLKVAKRLTSLGAEFEFLVGRIVRTTGPNWYQVVLDIRLKQ